MPQATGIPQRRGYLIDRDAVLFGSVRAGDQSAAETRNGSARLLSNNLTRSDFKIIAKGKASNAAGGYLIQVAHVPKGGVVGDANPTGYVTVGSIVFRGTDEAKTNLEGNEIEAAIRAAASPAITDDVRAVALRLVAGTGTGAGGNGVAAPVNTTGAVIFYTNLQS